MRAAKTISSGLEARIVLNAKPELAALLKKNAASLPGFFIVSQVEVADAGNADGGAEAVGVEGLRIHVERAQGAKCARCWNFSRRVGENADNPTVCERCVAALAEIDRGAASQGPKS